MGVLDHPASPDAPPAVRIANQLKQTTRSTYNHLVQVFNSGAQMFWKNPRATPVEIAAALGTDAKELFELHAKIGALLATIKPEAIADGAAAVGQFTYNNNGTVTVTSPTPTGPVGPANG